MPAQPGAWKCCHSGLSAEELLIDLEDEEISDVQLLETTVRLWPSRFIKHNFPSWSVERIPLAGAGRGLTVSHLFPSKASTTSNSSLSEPRPPATTKTSVNLVLTEDV